MKRNPSEYKWVQVQAPLVAMDELTWRMRSISEKLPCLRIPMELIAHYPAHFSSLQGAHCNLTSAPNPPLGADGGEEAFRTEIWIQTIFDSKKSLLSKWIPRTILNKTRVYWNLPIRSTACTNYFGAQLLLCSSNMLRSLGSPDIGLKEGK